MRKLTQKLLMVILILKIIIYIGARVIFMVQTIVIKLKQKSLISYYIMLLSW